MINIGAPINIEKLYKFDDDVSNPQLFETWKPKIKAYLKDLKNQTPEEYLVPESEIPETLDVESFDTIKYLKDTTYLSNSEKLITAMDVITLEKSIASKKLSSVEVLKAFAHRAVIANQFTNFAAQIFIKEALTKAKNLDSYLAKTGKTIGPLHGIPVSVKEQIGMAGKITHGGWVAWLDYIPKEDATSVKMLKKLGAVLFVRTNEPQTLMHLDSNNNITGRTRNPYNSLLSAGGSSGGEGCCVSSHSSAIGLGSDIGGSIRAPAGFCGCYGFRPSSRRISTAGGVSSGKGQESIVAVEGPLAHSAADVNYFMDGYINTGKPWEDDPWSLPMPWRHVKKPEPADITVAIMYDNGLVKPLPPIERGLKEVTKKLKAAGVNVITLDPICISEAYDVCHQLYTCDGNRAQKEMIRPSGEPLLPLTKWAFSMGNGDKQLSITENRALNTRRDNLRKKYNDYFIQNKVDFIISPTYASVAPCTIQDGIAGPYFWGYTSLWNVLDLPTLVAPTGMSQDPKIDQAEIDYEPRSEIDEIEHAKYIPELFSGAPICFQLTGRKYFDEDVVAFGELFQDIMEA